MLEINLDQTPEEITPSPTAPATPPRSRVLLLAGGAAAVLLAAFFLVQYFFSPPGSLQVTSTRPGAAISVSGKNVGATDYVGNFRFGQYPVEVSDASRSAKAWSGQVKIQAGALTSVERDLGPTSEFSGGVILSLSRGSGITVTSNPAGAQVYLDGTDIGKSPLSRPAPSPGNHEIKIHLDGYVDKTVTINVTNGWKLEVAVDLYLNPDFGADLVDTKDIKSAAPSDLTFTSREALVLDKILGESAPSSYGSWTKAQLWSLKGTDQNLVGRPADWLKGLYYHAVAHLLLPDLPWHYLIDSSGTIYEGRGGGFGVTSLDPTGGLTAAAQAPTLKPGLVMVGYLGGDPTQAAKDSFAKLVTWLGQPPKLSASPTAPQELSLDAEKQAEVTITFKNTGTATWQNFGDSRMTMSAVGGNSALFTQGNWIDAAHPATSTEAYVPKSKTGTFKFTVTAPKYGGDYEQKFNLVQAGKTVESSEVKLTVHVTGPAKPAAQVKILNTPTGFLRVRSGPGTGYAEVAQVKPGETYEYLEAQTGWYKIKVSDTITGWVSTQFATKI